jgi:DNA-binding Xre family transcriptional regulator
MQAQREKTGGMMNRTRLDRFKVVSRWSGRLDDLAKKADMSPNTLYNALDGYNWTSTTLDKIAAALGCRSIDIITVDSAEIVPSERKEIRIVAPLGAMVAA